jgi:hypothetical protein
LRFVALRRGAKLGVALGATFAVAGFGEVAGIAEGITMKADKQNRPARGALALGVFGLLGLASGTADAAVRIDGQVQAGGGSVAGSTVTLWAASAGEPKQLAQATTADDGSFALGTDETPGTGESLYVIAKGGVASVNASVGENPALAFLTALGATLPTHLTINEMTTVASVWTNAQFLDGAAIKGPALSLADKQNRPARGALALGVFGGRFGGSVNLLKPDGTPYPGSPFTGGGLPGPWAAAVDGDDNVWISNFAMSSSPIVELCGVRTENCPPGMKTGDQISPPGGYVGGGLQMQTDIDIDPAGDVWAMNNWQVVDSCYPNPPEALSTRCGGQGVVVFYGMAKPVRAPQIGPARGL